MTELAVLSVGLEGALSYALRLGETTAARLQQVCVGTAIAFEMGRKSCGLVLNVIEEATAYFAERELEGEVYETALLTPSQAEVKNHINSLAGLTRRWVPA